MANDEHVSVARQGAVAIRRWRKLNPGVQLDLRNADLSDLDLSSLLKNGDLAWGVQGVRRG